MVYTHPHGVSCAHCHGLYGEGKKIGTLPRKVVKNEKVVVVRVPIFAPNIQKISLEKLREQLNHRKSSLMPRYPLLTPVEIKALWYYLNYTAPKNYQKFLEAQRRKKEERAKQPPPPSTPSKSSPQISTSPTPSTSSPSNSPQKRSYTIQQGPQEIRVIVIPVEKK